MSKILSYFLHPFAWIVILLFSVLVVKNAKRKKKLLIITFLILIVFSNKFICDEALRIWEVPNLKAIADSEIKSQQLNGTVDGGRKYEAGILLGGNVVSFEKSTGRVIFRSGADRVLQTIYLYKSGVIKRIVISGGSGHLLYKDRTEASFIKKYLTSVGIPSDDILFESSSRNTIQNARYTSALLKDNNITGRVLLITSALHMRRAAATFEKAGVDVDEYATNKISGIRITNFDHLFIPSVNSLRYWNMLIHEILGYGVYKVLGYL